MAMGDESVQEVTVQLPAHEIVSMSRTMPQLVRVADENTEIINVPLISQKESGYVTGCELVSAAMVLRYYNREVTAKNVYEVIAKVSPSNQEEFLDADPNRVFIGDPYNSSGFGCYAAPLTDAMNQILQEEYHAINVSGMSLDVIEETYLSQGTPVVIWATIRMTEPKEGARWTLGDGTEFQWPAGEHCLVLVGADEEYYYFNDPDWEGEVVAYEKSQVEQRYQQLGRQAIIVSR